MWVVGATVLGCVVPETVAKPGSGEQPLVELFPESSAPTFYEKKSELVLREHFAPGQRFSKWHPEVDEKDVFQARLQHKSVTERSWELGIGKGGQIYSIYSSFGEAMPPQTPHSRWMDEAWQFTTIYEPLLGRDLPKEIRPFSNSFIHQSGIYTREKEIKPFYSPILATHFDPQERSYSVLSWGQIPHASINRSGVLVYAKYRDLGAGAIEVTYVAYNFEKEPMTCLSPWGGVRTSVFPEHVVSNPDGSYRFFDPFHYNYDRLEGCRIHFKNTGGWAAATANADDPYSWAIGVVFGKGPEGAGEHYRRPPRYDCGDSRHGTRDYTVQTTVMYVKDVPGTAHMVRMYFVIGTLAKVAEKANRLADHAGHQALELTETDTPLAPLYARRIGKDTVLSREAAGNPLCHAYAWPVRSSVPLFLMRNNETKRHFVTTDPYAQCDREPFDNPFEPGHKLHDKYENRTVYRPYLKKAEWIELLGFVVPKEKADTGTHGYTVLSGISAVKESFYAGDKLAAEDVVVRRKGT